MHMGLEVDSWIYIVAGAALLILPNTTFVAEGGALAWWSMMVAGAILVLLGGFDAWAAATGRTQAVGLTEYVGVLVGAWLVGFAYFSTGDNAYMYASIGIGAVALVAGIYGLWAASQSRALKGRPA